ncbi:S-adenosyl-L-methionine-dependent methyltransferase, partial [Mytilinidion resinicola]
ENGRRFANPKFKSSYTLPNDEPEFARLDRQHEQFCFMFGGELGRAPLIKEEVKTVVDIGTGTGIWATDFAKKYPDAKVVGIDISPVEVTEKTPANCSFQLADFTAPSTWAAYPPASLSYIHGRMIAVGVRSWTALARQCYDALAPGGWVEIQELSFPLRCDDGSAPPDGPMLQWSANMMAGGAAFGVDMTGSRYFPDILVSTGFEEVTLKPYQWPNNPYSSDPVLRAIGESQQHNFRNGLEGFSVGLFTKALGWSLEKTMGFLGEVREVIGDTREHVYMPMLVMYGRKPLAK